MVHIENIVKVQKGVKSPKQKDCYLAKSKRG